MEDRLLAIDDHPLSCLSSSNALCLLKSSISRITGEKEPFVRLLVARRTHGVDGEEPSPITPQQPANAEVLSRRIGGLKNLQNFKRGEGGNSGSLDSLVSGLLGEITHLLQSRKNV